MGTHQEEGGGEEGVYEGEEVHGAAEAEETCYEGDDDAVGMIRPVLLEGASAVRRTRRTCTRRRRGGRALGLTGHPVDAHAVRLREDVRVGNSTNRDVEEIAAGLDKEEVEEDDCERFGGCYSENLGVEAGVETGVERSKEDVGDEGHDCGHV